MATILHREKTAHTSGELPSIGKAAPDFRLTKSDLKDVSLGDFHGKRIVLNIFPSIDTSTCATSVRKFNALASAMENTVVLCISKDLPFAVKRFCIAEGLDNVVCLSQYKDQSFSENYNVDIVDGSSLIGLMARAIVVIDENGVVAHHELVSDISHEPNYDAVLGHLN
jgi:thiol peroxidase